MPAAIARTMPRNIKARRSGWTGSSGYAGRIDEHVSFCGRASGNLAPQLRSRLLRAHLLVLRLDDLVVAHEVRVLFLEARRQRNRSLGAGQLGRDFGSPRRRARAPRWPPHWPGTGAGCTPDWSVRSSSLRTLPRSTGRFHAAAASRLGDRRCTLPARRRVPAAPPPAGRRHAGRAGRFRRGPALSRGVSRNWAVYSSWRARAARRSESTIARSRSYCIARSWLRTRSSGSPLGCSWRNWASRASRSRSSDASRSDSVLANSISRFGVLHGLGRARGHEQIRRARSRSSGRLRDRNAGSRR